MEDRRQHPHAGSAHAQAGRRAGAGHGAGRRRRPGGLSAGDVLVAIDGLRVDAPAGLELLLAQYRPGDRVTIHVFRRDELRAFRVRLGAPQAGLRAQRVP